MIYASKEAMEKNRKLESTVEVFFSGGELAVFAILGGWVGFLVGLAVQAASTS